MIFHRMKPSNVIRLGLVFLCLGAVSLSRWYPGRSIRGAVSLMDGLSGFFYGLAIALLLIGLRMKGRKEPQS
jgi:hypothetical protein